MSQLESNDRSEPYVPPVALEEGAVLAHRGKLFVAIGVFVLALGFLGYTAFQGASAYYLTVGEMKAKGASIYDENLRVSGKLEPTSFDRDSTGTIVHFSLVDANGVETMDAVYDGPVPDLFFNEHSEIVLEGTYGADGLFDAQAIMVKCPSKYEAVEESA